MVRPMHDSSTVFWVGGNNITDDGYISDGFYYYLTVLRTDGEPSVYKLLDSRMANDGLWYNGCSYTSAYEYLYDFYADYAGLDVPRYMIHVYFNGDELSRENVAQTSDDCEARRYDGDGWYIYLSTVVWKKTKGEDSWYSGYYTGSALRVDKSYDSVKAMEDFYRDSGFTLKQYREGAALSGPWTRYDAESGTQFANYLAPDPDYGGCYIISTYWVPTDEIVTNQWGEWDKGAQVEREAIWLRGMAQSFTVSGNVHSYVPTFQNDLDLASEGRAAWLYLVENGETVGSYSVRGAWNVPALNSYHYSTCDAPENTDRQLILWLSDNDNSYFSLNKNTDTQQPGFTPNNKTSYLGFYEGTNIVAYHRSMTDPVDYYEAQDNFSIVDNDGRTLYDVIRTWYDEAELSALREEIGPLDKSLSWQEAAQQWADLTDADGSYGVSVLNDSKYGISVNGGKLRLSLHKGGLRPDFKGDRGFHHCVYSFLPHDSGFSAESVIRPAYELNVPAAVTDGKYEAQKLIDIDADNIFVEAVKPCEDAERAFIVRMYEAEGTFTTADVRFFDGAKSVKITNMLEEEQSEVESIAPAKLQFRPFEIKTLKVTY